MSDALKRAGQRLANAAYNLAQRDSLPGVDRQSLRDGYKAWDAALSAPETGDAGAHPMSAPFVYDGPAAMGADAGAVSAPVPDLGKVKEALKVAKKVLGQMPSLVKSSTGGNLDTWAVFKLVEAALATLESSDG